jgi:hypothetical protein
MAAGAGWYPVTKGNVWIAAAGLEPPPRPAVDAARRRRPQPSRGAGVAPAARPGARPAAACDGGSQARAGGLVPAVPADAHVLKFRAPAGTAHDRYRGKWTAPTARLR